LLNQWHATAIAITSDASTEIAYNTDRMRLELSGKALEEPTAPHLLYGFLLAYYADISAENATEPNQSAKQIIDDAFAQAQNKAQTHNCPTDAAPTPCFDTGAVMMSDAAHFFAATATALIAGPSAIAPVTVGTIEQFDPAYVQTLRNMLLADPSQKISYLP
jgi:hypothetical protein